MKPVLEIQALGCGYQNQVILNAVDFSIDHGEIACLIGPSGCGKTTLLRTIAGFNAALSGQIQLENEIISNNQFTLEPENRSMGMVFQDYALFPHLKVADNIGFGLCHLSFADKRKRVIELLELVRLQDFGKYYPHELSGGQQQRVALARALALRPKLLLMDEPFSNLDTDLRQQLALEVKTILKQEGISAIIVTHDKQEAFTLADKIGVLADRKLQQWGAAQILYSQPRNLTVANFVGKGEVFVGRYLSDTSVDTELGVLTFPKSCFKQTDAKMKLFLRPQDMQLTLNGSDAIIESMDFLGAMTRYHIKLHTGRSTQVISNEANFHIGDSVSIKLNIASPIIV